MNTRALMAAALMATLGGAVDCIDDGYDPLQPGEHRKRAPGMSDPIDMPGSPDGRAVRTWHDARARPVAFEDERTVRDPIDRG